MKKITKEDIGFDDDCYYTSWSLWYQRAQKLDKLKESKQENKKS